MNLFCLRPTLFRGEGAFPPYLILFSGRFFLPKPLSCMGKTNRRGGLILGLAGLALVAVATPPVTRASIRPGYAAAGPAGQGRQNLVGGPLWRHLASAWARVGGGASPAFSQPGCEILRRVSHSSAQLQKMGAAADDPPFLERSRREPESSSCFGGRE